MSSFRIESFSPERMYRATARAATEIMPVRMLIENAGFSFMESVRIISPLAARLALEARAASYVESIGGRHLTIDDIRPYVR